MAIVRTSKVSVYVPGKKINEVIEFLHTNGVIEPTEGERTLPKSTIEGIRSELVRCDRAIKTAEKYRPSGFLKHKNSKHKVGYEFEEKTTKSAKDTIDGILNLLEEKREISSRLDIIRARISELEPFFNIREGSFVQESEGMRRSAFYLPAKGGGEILDRLRKMGFYYETDKLEKTKELVWVLYKKSKEAELSGLCLERPKTQLSGVPPLEETDRLLRERDALTRKDDELSGELETLSKNRKNMELYYDRLLLKEGRYKSLMSAKNTERIFVITGYVLNERINVLSEKLRLIGAVMEIEQPKENEILPVAFKNNELVAPVEGITEGYSMPSDKDIDPNPIMAVFYYWFFGMMFSDAGYGVLMMAVCGVLGYSRILRNRKMYQMFFWCGLSTTLWGLLYGSFFGDLIGVVSRTFGEGKSEFKPIFLDPTNQALELLILSVCFGLVHILTALGISFYRKWRDGDKTGAVYDVGSWISVLVGAALYVPGAFIKLAVIKNIGTWLAVLGAAVLVIMSGRDKKSPVMRIFSGILSLYDITSYVGDILSYSRLMALGLATGVIASVVNVLASLGGNSVLGAIVFVLVAVLGHSLNFAINMLGAYVHTNRLQFVEFYQKFYEGGGRKFSPIGPETRYFEFGQERIEKL